MEILTEYVYEANSRATMHSIACHERGHGRWNPRKRGREGQTMKTFGKQDFGQMTQTCGRRENEKYGLVHTTPATRMGVQCNRNKVVLVFWSFGVNVINILQVKYSTIYLTGQHIIVKREFPVQSVLVVTIVFLCLSYCYLLRPGVVFAKKSMWDLGMKQ